MSTLATREAEPLRRVGKARARDHEDDVVPEFDVLYRRYFRFTWSVLRRLGVPQASTEDAAQEAWVIVHRRLDALESPRAVRSWLFQIARRVAARHRRGEQRSRRKLDALGWVPARLDLPHADRDSLLTMEALLGQLDARKREAFVLSELEGWSAPEIAKAAGTNPNTVYSRIRLAREELRARWESRCPGADLELALVDLRERTQPPKGAAKRGWILLAPKLALGGAGPAAVAGASAVATWKLAIAGTAVIALAAVGGTYTGHRGSSTTGERAAAEKREASPGRGSDDARVEASSLARSQEAEPAPLGAQSADAPHASIATKKPLASDAPASGASSTAALASGATTSAALAPRGVHSSEGTASADASDDSPSAASTDTRPSATQADAASLDDENGLLAAAQTSLAAGEPERALRQLARHRERFAASPLADLRALLELKALCAAGRKSEADAALRRAEATMAGSALLPKMRRACAE